MKTICLSNRSLLAMADTKGSLDYWRKFFGSAKSDIFELIEKAILVAMLDCPNELKDRRDLLVEKLFTSPNSLCSECKQAELQALVNGDDDPKEEKNSSECDNAEENQIVREVMRIKEVLCKNDEESVSVLYESLRALQAMQLSVETLKATEIGRAVNDLRKHNSGHIQRLAKSLIEGWKVSVDDWVKSAAVITGPMAGSVDRLNESSMNDSDHKPSSHMLTVNRKPLNTSQNKSSQSDDDDDSKMSKLEIAKRKLREGYQRVENEKKRRMIRVIEPNDLPMESHEKRRPKRKKEIRLM